MVAVVCPLLHRYCIAPTLLLTVPAEAVPLLPPLHDTLVPLQATTGSGLSVTVSGWESAETTDGEEVAVHPFELVTITL